MWIGDEVTTNLLLGSSVRYESSLAAGQELDCVRLRGHVSQVLGGLVLAVPGEHVRPRFDQQPDTLTWE